MCCRHLKWVKLKLALLIKTSMICNLKNILLKNKSSKKLCLSKNSDITNDSYCGSFGYLLIIMLWCFAKRHDKKTKKNPIN